MDRLPVTSSNLASVGYESETKTLEVEFHTGDIWQYDGVPKGNYALLMSAPSVGSYFAQQIKSVYPGRKITPAVTDAKAEA